MKKKAKQVSSLYTSMVLGLGISFGVSIVNTRLLGPQQYGDLKFLQNIFVLVAGCLTLGVFTTGSTLLAQKRNERLSREIIGNLIVFAALISLLLSVGFFVFSYFEESIFQNNLGRIIRIFSPFLFVLPFQFCLEKIFVGDNRIYKLSIFQLAPKTLYLAGAIAFNYFVPLTLSAALGLQLMIFSLVIVIMSISLKPKFGRVRNNLSKIWKENKTYGFHVYIGFLAAVVSGQLAGVWIAYFIDNVNVGFYALALTITMPLTMIPNAVSSTFFKDFANKNSIPRGATAFTVVASISALAVFFLVIDKVILMVYSEAYSPVIPLVYLISIGSIAHGFGDYFNRFLGAHGQGKTMRNGSVAVGVFNLVGYYLFVKYLGVTGAAVTKVASSLTYLCVRYYPYHRLASNLEATESL